MSRIANVLVEAVLRSPARRVLSSSTDVIRYQGQRTGATYSTPTQYARSGEDVLILVAHPERKTWWRNFRCDRDIELLLDGKWVPMVGRAVSNRDEPEGFAPLRDAYLARFPRAAHVVTEEMASTGSVVVSCRHR